MPHGAVRAYVMGERANDRLATQTDIAEMAHAPAYNDDADVDRLLDGLAGALV